jgi:hypothetical protein
MAKGWSRDPILVKRKMWYPLSCVQFIHTTAKGGDPLWAGGTGWLSTPIYPAGLAIALCEKRGALTPPKRRCNCLRHRLPPNDTTKPNGMGMGLSICRSIIGRLGIGQGVRYFSLRSRSADVIRRSIRFCAVWPTLAASYPGG